MRLRKDHDYAQRRQQIIDGALDVFSRKGFEKTTNKDIARAAGIGSPGLIYHYFTDKDDLFRAVIEQWSPAFRLVAHPETLMALPPREGLTLFAQSLFKILDNHKALAALKLILGEATRRPDVANAYNQAAPGRAFPILARYLAQQMEAGRLRHADPGAAVRCFMGPLLIYILTREIFPPSDSETLSPDAMITTTVDVFMRGLQVNGDAGDTNEAGDACAEPGGQGHD